jgi:cytochrome b6-f complex iron-sulfur subunit
MTTTTAAAAATTTTAAAAMTTTATTTAAAAAAAGGAAAAPAGYTLVGPVASYKADADPVAFTVNSIKGYVFNSGGTFMAFSEVCTHAGCKVPYKPADSKFECPCHGSQYDKTGEVVKGPAKTRLAKFDTTVVGDSLFAKVS